MIKLTNLVHIKPHSGYQITSGEILCQRQTPDGFIEVRDTYFRGHYARLLFMDGALQSAMVLEEGRGHMLLFPYMQCFSWPFSAGRKVEKSLLIGGGGFVWPRYSLKMYPDCAIDAVEISGDILKAAREYFSLDELCEYPEFNLIEGDGLAYLMGSEKQYDLIILDAFTGADAASELFTEGGLSVIKAHLMHGGMCICNIVTSVSGLHSFHGRGMKRHFSEYFRNVSLMQANASLPPAQVQNCVLLASDEEL